MHEPTSLKWVIAKGAAIGNFGNESSLYNYKQKESHIGVVL